MILHINSMNERKLSRRNYIQLGSMQLSETLMRVAYISTVMFLLTEVGMNRHVHFVNPECNGEIIIPVEALEWRDSHLI